jgi:hypothetical protein
VTGVADIYTHLADGRVEHRVPQVAWAEVEFLPEATYLGDVGLAVLAQIGAIGINDGGGVIVNAHGLFFVHRNYQDHLGLLGQFLHALDGRAIGDRFGQGVPFGILLLGEIGAVE